MNQHTTPTNQRTLCRTCVTPIAYIDAPTGGWWAHDTHPADGHDAVPGAWVDSDPLMEAIAAAVWEHCGTEGTSLVVDDPRNIAGTATAVARRFVDAEQAGQRAYEQRLREQHDRDVAELIRLRACIAELERPAVEAKRNEVRDSYAELVAAAEETKDFEGAFDVQCRLREREEQWKAEDAATVPAAVETGE